MAETEDPAEPAGGLAVAAGDGAAGDGAAGDGAAGDGAAVRPATAAVPRRRP